MRKAPTYSKLEETMNVATHGLGLVLAIPALIFLILEAVGRGNAWHIVSFTIFGVSMIILYAASTFYHAAKDEKTRKHLQVFDHASIYVLIAGSYTPYTLVTLNGAWGWSIFGVTWGLAIAGVILKIFFTGKYNLVSTLGYVGMGWIAVLAIKPLMENLEQGGLFWLFLGGIFYTVGAVLYQIKRIPLNHAVFHVFVLLGSASHFVSVYWYVY
ncbi:MAG TPA: hemolysin D [Bacteroidales bacterium]|nr:hemolysin D [Bacteroidales bacterium]